MEFSVRFFKRLILLVLALMILVPTALAVRFGVSSHRLAEENGQLGEQLAKTQLQLEEKLSRGEPGGGPAQAQGQDLPYQALWKELYRVPEAGQALLVQDHTVYLTFNGGPSEQTKKLLDALDKAGVKATFFVTGRGDSPETRAVLKEIVDRGHAIGVLSYTYDYRTIYATVGNFLEDFDQARQMIFEATGVETGIFRFPGGSVNSYNYKLYQPLIAEMLRRGFVFYDWNVSGLDNVRGTSAEVVAQTVIDDVQKYSRAIVELRDGGTGTADALPRIVEELEAAGYTFAPLTEEVAPITFSYEQG